MGEALHLTLRLATGGYVGLTPPLLLVLKIVPSLTELPIFQIHCNKRTPPPLHRKWVPSARGPPCCR